MAFRMEIDLHLVANDVPFVAHVQEPIDDTAVLSMHLTGGVAEETDVQVGLINGKEAEHSALEPCDDRVADLNHRVTCLIIPESTFDVRDQVGVDNPPGIVLLVGL
jgi:hypothetical protein